MNKDKTIDDTEIDEDEPRKKFVVRSAADVQRIRLEKLMKNPDKPIVIPELPRDKSRGECIAGSVPSFVRNVMGSSAGAGSGEFHVYRHLRRKEYARQKQIQEKSKREQLDDDYHNKLEQYKKDSESKTAKKRAKRLKRKQKLKQVQKRAKTDPQNNNQKSDNSESSSDAEESDSNLSGNDKSNANENEPQQKKEENLDIDKPPIIGSSEKITTTQEPDAEKDETTTIEAKDNST